MADSTDPAPVHLAIPDALRNQLADFQRQLWRIKVLEAIAAAVIGLLCSFLLIFLLDRFLPTPPWARLLILLAGTSLSAVFMPYWLHRWVWKHRKEEQLARLIAQRYPGLGDRLLGVIELQTQAGTDETLSPQLRAAAMQAVAAEVHGRSLQNALPAQRHFRWGMLSLALIAIAIGVFVWTPRAASNALQRWILPLSNVERYTFTKLDAPPHYLAVPFGEAFDVTLTLAKESEQRPNHGIGQYGQQPPIEAKRQDRSFHFTIPGQQQAGNLTIRLGDLRHVIQVEPMQRPTAERIDVTITPPAYLQIPEETRPLQNAAFSAVPGSTFAIQITANRELQSGSYGPASFLSDTDPELETPSTSTSLGGPLRVSSHTAQTPILSLPTQATELPFSWVDRHGLSNDQGFTLRIEPKADDSPMVYLQGVERQQIMLPDEVLDLEVLAEDDFGLREVGLAWSGETTQPSPDGPSQGEFTIDPSNPNQKRVIEPAHFAPKALGINPQKISLRGFAADYFPERERTYSEPITIYILTRDEHAQMLKNQFDRNIAELEEVARHELELYEENQRLERLEGDELQLEDNQKRMNAQESGERQNTRRMEELTERMESLLQDAIRNGEIAKDTLKKTAEALATLQDLSQEAMPEVSDLLAEAQQPSNTPEKAQQDVQSAVEKQAEVLKKMEQAIAQATDANQDFEAGTFVNRLKKAAADQQTIASTLVEGFSAMLGQTTAQLDPREQRRIDDASSQQSATASDIRWLQEDLSHYFARTDLAAFKQIYDAMRDSSIDQGLEQVRQRLAKSHAYQATEEATLWATRLTEWAALLEDANQEAGGDGGGGGGGSPEDQDFEFMLRVMRMVQKQQDLRGQTRALEQLRRSSNSKMQP